MQNAASNTAMEMVTDQRIVGDISIRRALTKVIPRTCMTNITNERGNKLTIHQARDLQKQNKPLTNQDARNAVSGQSHRPTKRNSTVYPSNSSSSNHVPSPMNFLRNKSRPSGKPSQWNRNGLSNHQLNPPYNRSSPISIDTTPVAPSIGVSVQSPAFATAAAPPAAAAPPETPPNVRIIRNGRKRIRRRSRTMHLDKDTTPRTKEALVEIQTDLAEGRPTAATQSIDDDAEDGMQGGSQDALTHALYLQKMYKKAKTNQQP